MVGGPERADLGNMFKVKPTRFGGMVERNCESEDGYDFGLNIWKNGVDIYLESRRLWKGFG